MTNLSYTLCQLAANRSCVSLYFYPDQTVGIDNFGWVKTRSSTVLELRLWIKIWRMTSGIGEHNLQITLHNIDEVMTA